VTILDEILVHKRREVALALERVPAGEMARAAGEKGPVRGLRARLEATPGIRVIAEIKRRSPSRGEIRADFDPVRCAKAYAEAGAAALSVLTDARYFGGELGFLPAVRAAVDLPILRKDFVVDPYQIDEARVHGADAVLLIVAALARDALPELRRYAAKRGLEVLVEVHDDSELDAALETGADLIGINNRDLRTFEIDLGVTERLAGRVPPGVVVVAESGIFTHDDVQRLLAAGAHAFLVGESLMREADVGLALRKLRGTT
jgi:indole-3-glycerol phosphate synthase